MQMITDNRSPGGDEMACPTVQPVPHFLTVQGAADAGASPSSNEAAPPRILSMPAGPLHSAKRHVPVAPAQSVCTFPAGLSFEGEASFPCDFAVMGTIKGKVMLSGQSKLVVAAGGVVDGEIVAKSISIDGEVCGRIDASGGLVSFGGSARCSGTIQYGRMSMAEGAEVDATMKRVG